jgi:hypothetical protein
VSCQDNNLSLNVSKTKELIVDYRKRQDNQAPINIDGAVVERVESFKFLGVHITNELLWSKHTKTVMKRARQNLLPLRRLKRLGMGSQIHKKLYSCTIESILTGCIAAWYGNCSASNHKAMQRVMRMVQYITGVKLHAIQDLYNRWSQRKAQYITGVKLHAIQDLYNRWSQRKAQYITGVKLHAIQDLYNRMVFRTKRLLNSFYPQAIRLLNN